MAKVYRTDDLTRWGFGLNRNLTSVEVDLNFWDSETRLDALEDHQELLVSIDYITQVGNQLTFHMTDHTLQGPFTLPVAIWNRRTDNHGMWAPLTVYAIYDVFDEDGSLYIVLVGHTSAATFDPNATDGMGHRLYGLLLTAPSDVLPPHGDANEVLAKRTGADFDVYWKDNVLADLEDVALVSPLDANDSLVWNGTHWQNEAGLGAIIKISPFDPGDLLSWNGSNWHNLNQSLLSISYTQLNDHATAAQNRQPTATVLGTTGTVSLNPALGDVFKVTPTGDITLNAASAPVGAHITLVVTTSGATSYNITPTTSFKSTGVLATGTASGKVFTISFVGDGTNLNEISRTVAM